MSGLERVDYTDRGTALIGWLARPAGPARGAVVVFPTIANVLPAIERRAAMLAELGYVAMIADFYGEPVASFEASRPLAEALRGDVDHYRARLSAAVTALQTLQGKALLTFSRESIKEVRKVVWPTRQETIQTTLIIFAFTVVMGLFLFLIDGALIWLVELITGMKG